MRHSFHAFALAGALLAVPLAAARADLITNGGFETGQLGSGAYSYEASTFNSWTYSGNAVLINVGGGGGPWISNTQTGYGGSQVAGVQTTGSIAQTFLASITGSYQVSWLDAGRSYSTNVGNQTYLATLYDNTTATTVASLSRTTASGSIFNAETLTGFNLVAGNSYTLSFTGQDTADETALIDNVGVSQVPEPATIVLFGTGLAGLGWLRRRKAI